MNGTDTKTRTIAKTVVWRVFATLITWAVASAFTGTIVGSLALALVAAALAMIAYYIHERIWNNISWGRKEN